MAFRFPLAGVEVTCDTAQELHEALAIDTPGATSGGAGAEEGEGNLATTQATSQANGTNGHGPTNGNGQRSLETLQVEELPLVESPIDFDKVRKVMKQLHLPEGTDQRQLRSLLKQRQELVEA